MQFCDGFLWGSGLSLGICAGSVAWLFLRAGSHWMLGIKNKEHDSKALAALTERNDIGYQQLDALVSIAESLKSRT